MLVAIGDLLGTHMAFTWDQLPRNPATREGNAWQYRQCKVKHSEDQFAIDELARQNDALGIARM
jgi:hypothetical protein